MRKTPSCPGRPGFWGGRLPRCRAMAAELWLFCRRAACRQNAVERAFRRCVAARAARSPRPVRGGPVPRPRRPGRARARSVPCTPPSHDATARPARPRPRRAPGPRAWAPQAPGARARAPKSAAVRVPSTQPGGERGRGRGRPRCTPTHAAARRARGGSASSPPKPRSPAAPRRAPPRGSHAGPSLPRRRRGSARARPVRRDAPRVAGPRLWCALRGAI